MCQLLLAEVTVARPSVNAGIDCVDPFGIKSGYIRSKSAKVHYVERFICMASNAIHIGLFSNLSPEAFIPALNSFFW